jgi:hypothetical protein
VNDIVQVGMEKEEANMEGLNILVECRLLSTRTGMSGTDPGN